jgi:uncharacterized repeat protein (TIGR01451 family)
MKLKLLCIWILFIGGQIAAQITKVETYQIGTQIDYYIGECGGDIPESQGKLSFCDRAGNLAVVEESLGLSDRGTLALLPNYYNDSEVYVTRNGISIYHQDGSWENIPNVAFQNPELTSWNNTGSVTGGVLKPDGKLQLFVNAAGFYIHTYDVLTKELSLSVSTASTGNGFPAIRNITYDDQTDKTYVVMISSGNRSLYEYVNNSFVLLSDSSELLEIFQNPTTTTTIVKDGLLYAGSLNGFFVIDLDSPGMITKYDATETNTLPFDKVNDFEIADDGMIWLAQQASDNNAGGVTKFDIVNGTYESYTRENPGNAVVDLLPQSIALNPNGLVHITVSNYGGIADLDFTDGTPNWVFTEDPDFEALGVPITYFPSDVYVVNGVTYYVTNDFSSGNTDNYEVVIRNGDMWTGRNDDDPSNISFWMIERFREAHPTSSGGSIWSNDFDDIIVSIDENDIFSSNRSFLPTARQGAIDNDDRFVSLLGVPGQGSDVRKVYEPVSYEYPSENNGGDRFVTQYNDQIWVFNQTAGTIEIYIQDNLVQTYDLDPAINLTSYFRGAVDSNGIFWAVKSSFPSASLLRFDPTTEMLIEISLTSDFGPTRGIEVAPDGGIWLLSSTDAIFYKDNIEYAFPNDFLDSGTIQDGQVDVNGKMHLITVGGIGGDLHTIENPTALDPIITSINLVNNTNESLLPTENTSTTDDIIIDVDGDYWINSSRGFYKIIDDDPSPAYRTDGTTKGIISGRLYGDLNTNGMYDEGEAIAGVSLTLVVNGQVQNTISDGEGIYRIFAQEENTTHTIVVNTIDDDYFLLDRTQEIAVTTLDQNYDNNDFIVDVKDYNSLFFKQGQRTGLWGFNRDFFENTFTLAITNMSTTETFNELSTTFLFENKNGDELPEILDVKFTKLDPNGAAQLHSKISINPRNGSWKIQGLPPDSYEQTVDNSISFMLTEETGKRRVLFTIPAIEPRDTWIIEIETDLFDPEQTGTGVIMTTESVSSPDFENADDPPGGDTFIMYPEEDRDFDDVPLIEDDPNSPYVDPFDPENGIYTDPKDVYAPSPYESNIFSSYDPNDKLVDGGNTLEINETDIARKWLTYTVRFENTGNFSAKDVYILDELDENILPDSFTLLETSNDVEVDFLPSGENESRILRFSFNDIFLPFDDENNDGWVKFRVRVKDDIVENTIVSNTAEIYFDQNPAIVTNTIQNLFLTPPDTQAPDMVCKNITVFLDENGEATIIATDVDEDSTDNEGIVTLEIDIETFNCSNLGENTVILTGTDAAGNSASCTAVVTVVDDTPPTAICQDVTLVLDSQGMATLEIDQVNNGSADNCDSVGLDLSKFSYNCDDLGTQAVTLFVTDSSGNQSTCEATITVVDEEIPTIVCQDLTVQLDENGLVTITPFDVDANDSSDNCGITNSTLSLETFTCDNLGENTVLFTVTDSSGNTSSCNIIVTVQDTIAPEFDNTTLPADQAVDADVNDMYILEDFTMGIVVTDNCDEVTITQSPAIGDILSPDLYVITITVTDPSGNTVQHTFTLDVRSTLGLQAPEISKSSVYPNPVSDVVYLRINSTDVTMQLYDLSGRLVQESQMATELYVGDLPRGVYLLNVVEGSGRKTFKIVKE